jgi:hypothetical protein
VPERFTSLLSLESNEKRNPELEERDAPPDSRSGEEVDARAGIRGGRLLVVGLVVRRLIFEAAGGTAIGHLRRILLLPPEFRGENPVQGRLRTRREDPAHEADGFHWSDFHAVLPFRFLSPMIGRVAQNLRAKGKEPKRQ